MKYLKEEDLKDRRGNPITIPVQGEMAEDGKTPKFELKSLTSGLFAYLSLDAYAPVQGFVIRQAEQRYYNSALNKLEKEPNSQGFWEFEDGEWNAIKGCVENIAPIANLLYKHLVSMDDVMKGVLDNLPDKKE